jgi:hypothetical protein
VPTMVPKMRKDNRLPDPTEKHHLLCCALTHPTQSAIATRLLHEAQLTRMCLFKFYHFNTDRESYRVMINLTFHLRAIHFDGRSDRDRFSLDEYDRGELGADQVRQ